MITINQLSDLPEWMRNTSVSLPVSIMDNMILETSDTHTIQDVLDLYRVLTYWELPTPDSLYRFLSNNDVINDTNRKKIMYQVSSTHANEIWILNSNMSETELLTIKDVGGEINTMKCLRAIRSKHFELLKWIMHNENVKLVPILLNEAVVSKQFDIVKYLWNNACPYSARTLVLRAVETRHLEMAEWLMTRCEWIPKDIFASAAGVSMDYMKRIETKCIEYLMKKGITINHQHKYIYSKDATEMAAANGLLPVLEYLIEKKCECSEHTCIVAAENGHIDCLVAAYEYGNAPLTPPVAEVSKKNGHYKCWRFYYETMYNGKFLEFLWYMPTEFIDNIMDWTTLMPVI